MYLALNNLQRLICHKTQQTKPSQSGKIVIFVSICAGNSIFLEIIKKIREKQKQTNLDFPS